ncbi:beta strand repeat-containing protein, partial [Flavobacterium sp. LB1P62]|uniref:beta strand repeat-containing protein n=1 Tax=Flavobacterium sp. LB1P62 TaxID=3401715 RepID=UPI003AAE19E7
MKTFLRNSGFLTIVFFIANLFFANVAFGQATVVTDKADYQPGDAVIVTGSGWQSGETVSLHFDETPQVCTGDHYRSTIADANGNIYYNQFLINIKHLGVSFVLTATGQSSGLSATTIFTDGGFAFGITGLSSIPVGNILVNYSWPESSGGGGSGTISTLNGAVSGNSQNKTLTFSYSPSSTIITGIKYNILNYTITRIQNGITSVSSQKSNSGVDSEANNISKSIVANYGALVASNVTGIYGSTVSLTSTLYSNYQTATGISGKTITFYVDGASVGTSNTNASGVATLNLDLTSVPSLGKLNSGVYTISSSFSGDTDYLAVSSANSTSGILTVNKKSITITAANQTVVYGTPLATVTGTGTYTAAGFMTPDTSSVIGGTATYTTTYTATTAAATAGVTITPVTTALTATNYSFTPLNGSITINKAAPTISVSGAQNFTYNSSAQGPSTISYNGDGTTSLLYTNTSGTVYSSATPPTNAGSYQVVASATAGTNFNTASSSALAFTIGKAATTTVVTVAASPFVYTGSAQTPATVSVTGAGGLNLTPAADFTNNTNAGTATASYTYAETANYLSSSDSEDFTIGKAATTTVVTVAVGPFAYTGSAQTPATVSVTGAGGLNLTPAADFTNNTNAGTATASYTYTETANYLSSSDSENFTIGKAATTTVVTIAAGPFAYTGSAQTPATVSVTGAGGLSLTPSADFTNNTNAGTATASYTYTETANYLSSSDSENFTIGKAATTTVVTVAAGPFAYTGSAQTPATVSVTGAGGLNLTPSADFTNNTNAGTATASYTYTETANYLSSSDSENFTIGKAATTTVVTIAAGPFAYTGSAQTPATVSVTGAGGLNLTPAADFTNNTNAGTATASYTYAETANYLSSTDSEDFTIGKAATTTVVTIAAGTFTYAGSAITPATVTVTGAGSLNLTPSAVYLNNINAGTATASYTYAATANYLSSTDSEDFTIEKAATTTVVTVAAGPFVYTGSAQTPATVSVTGAGGLSLTPAADFTNNTNAGTATASYTYAETANYLSSSDSEDFTIGKAATTTVVAIAAGPFVYTGLAQTPATVSVTGAGGLNLTPSADFTNNTNAGTATASYTYAETANYLSSSDSENFTIGKAATTTVVTIAAGPFAYTGSAQTPATISVTGAGGLSLTPSADFTNNTNAGTATASYTYAETANYLSSSDSENFTIGKAATTTVVTIAAGPFAYTGSAQTPATVSVTGAGGLNLTPS